VVVWGKGTDRRMIFSHRSFWRASVALTSLILPNSLFGQSVPNPPVTGPLHGEPSRTEVEPPAPASTKNPSTVHVDSQHAFSDAPCPLSGSNIRVNFKNVAFSGINGRPLPPVISSLLTPLSSDEQGDQPISVVCKVRDRVNETLRASGYIATAQIPPQDVTDGVLKLNIVVGRIVEIRVHGDIGSFRRVLTPRIAAIQALDPLNQTEIERLLLLADDIPGVNVQLALKPAGTVAGEVVGDLSVDIHRTTALINLQNEGSHQLGREVASLRGEVYGLTGHADRTYIAYSNTLKFKEENILQIGHDMALGSNGARIGVRVSYALSNPSIPNLDLRSRSLIAGLDLSRPLLRSLNTNVLASTGFEILNQQTQIRANNVSVPFTKDRLRVFYGRLEASTLGRREDGGEFWHLNGTVELRKGVNIFNATQLGGFENGYQPSRLNGDPNAFVVHGLLDAGVHLTKSFSLNGIAFGQWSNHSLLNIEQFSVGNLTYGRGYDPGANTADRAIALRAETRWRLPDYKGFRLELMGFYDYVRVYNLDPTSIENNRQLRSFGGGVRLIKSGRFALDITYAKPLDKALSTDLSRPTDRLLISLTTQLLPWRTR